jgi:hypothetical protein
MTARHRCAAITATVALINSDYMSGGICIPRAMIRELRELEVKRG